MALFRRNAASTELPEQAQVEYQDTNVRRWPTLVAYIILALLVATLVVLGGRWTYHKINNDNSSPAISTQSSSNQTGTSPSPSSNSSNKSTANPGSSTTTPAPSSNSSNSGTSSPTPTPTSPSTTTTPPSSSSNSSSSGKGATAPTPTPSSLPNNGPGQVVALFLGTSFLATALYRFTLTRRRSVN